jgi:glycine/D-amino acid oxidase-like deaminating enzyme
MEASELPKGAIYGMKYQTVVITPQKFLPWLCVRLEERGVKFIRTRVTSLSQLGGMGHDVLVNATGFGAEKLADVKERKMTSWRLQTVVVKNDSYDRLFIRRTPTSYSTAFARLDGTIYVGGALTEGSRDLTISEEHRANVITSSFW